MMLFLPSLLFSIRFSFSSIYISEAIWKDFQQNKQIKEILLNSKPVSFDDLENITCQTLKIG